jgi:prevent-host-death family protein
MLHHECMKLGLREADQQFSKVIKAVRAGKEVILTDRGRPIAVIKPIQDDGRKADVLRAMADEGLITLPSRKRPKSGLRCPPVTIKGKPLSQTVSKTARSQTSAPRFDRPGAGRRCRRRSRQLEIVDRS